MKHLRLSLALAIIGLFLLPVVASASTITDADYYAVIRVTNNSTATTGVSTVLTLSTADLISNGYINSNFQNIALRSSSGTDVPYMPSINATYPWSIFVPQIGANTQIDDVLYMGGATDMGVTESYFPASGGMAVTDHASLEPGANFTFEMTDTYIAPVGDILYKLNAFYLRSHNSTQVYCFSGNEWTTPAANATGTLWNNPANTYDDNTGTFAFFTITPLTFSNYFYLDTPSAFWSGYVRIYPQRVGAQITTMEVDGYNPNNGVWTAIYSGTPTYGAWNDLPISDLGYRGFYPYSQVRVRFYNSDAGVAHDARIHEFDWGQTNQLPVTGTFPSENDITITSDSVNVWLQVGSQTSANATVKAVYDNSNNWIWGGDNTPYIGTMRQTVGGVERGEWAWQYAATFTDQSGNGNAGTPTFRTASSDADVSAALVSFQPVATAQAPPYAVSDAPSFITTNITVNSNFTTGNVTGSAFPGSEVVDDASEAAGVPNIWLWGILAGVTLVFSGIGVSAMERFFGSGTGTLLFRILLGVLIIGLMIAFGKFDFWMLIIYLMIVITPALASRHNEPGASVSELNFIGFLSQTWLGLTVVSRIMQNQLLTTAETTHLNSMMFTQDFKLLDLFSMPIVNFNFFTEGIPALMRWNDYGTIFGGNAQMIQYFLYAITVIAGFIVFIYTVGLMTSYFTRTR